MLNRFFDWVQFGFGATTYGDDTSFSHKLLESLNFWTILEGTHLLTLMLFFGSILLVDLRLLGLTFRELPVSTLERRLLPATMVALVVVLATGALLFFAEPARYWHNLMFRAKLVFLALAFGNIVVFHSLIERNKSDWDASPRPPGKARLSAVVSLASWVLVMASGRLIAYNWLDCGKPQPAWVNASQDCAHSPSGGLALDGQPLAGGR
jgi:hypothetical protein